MRHWDTEKQSEELRSEERGEGRGGGRREWDKGRSGSRSVAGVTGEKKKRNGE